MPWSLTAENVQASSVEQELENSKGTQLEAEPFDSWDDDIEAQMDCAISAAVTLLESDTLGEGPFTVSMTGHPSRGDMMAPSVSVAISGTPQSTEEPVEPSEPVEPPVEPTEPVEPQTDEETEEPPTAGRGR